MVENKPDIIGVFGNEGAIINRKGRYYWCRCPLHDEKTPSCKIDAEKQTFYCFGCCRGGDVITFVEMLHDLSFDGALAYLGMIGNESRKCKPAKRAPDLIRLFKNFIRKEYLQRCIKVVHLYEFHQKSIRAPFTDEATAFLYSEIISTLPQIEHELDILWEGSCEDKLSFFKEIVENEKKKN